MATKNITSKIKFSQVTATPSALAVGELAYSTSSDSLFIGDATGTPIKIGGSADVLKLAGIEAGADVNVVLSVAGQTGDITLTKSDVGLANVDNTSDANKPISTATQTALNGKSDTGHGHAIADVTGLQTALDGKATTGHNHDSTYLGLGGGTLSGYLTLNAAPVSDLQAATKGYVDSVSAGLDFKASVVTASTANIDLATGGLLTVNSVTVADNDRVLVKNQTTASENGIYLAHAGSWVRALDADTTAEVTKGLFVFDEGSGSAYVCTSAGTLGSSDVLFTQFSAGTTYTAGTGLTLTGAEFSLANHSGSLITSGTVLAAYLPSGVVYDGDTLDGGAF